MTLKIVTRHGEESIIETDFVRYDPRSSTIYFSDDSLDNWQLGCGDTAYVMNSRGNTVAIYRANAFGEAQ